MANNTQVYEVVNSNPLFKTVADYINDSDSPAFQYSTDPESFLLVQNLSGQTNREVIEASYTTKFERDHFVGQPTAKLKLKVGIRLAVEQQKVNRAGLLTQGLEVVSNNVPLFKAQQLALLESQEGYNPAVKTAPGANIQAGTLVESTPDQTVWIWCRSLANASNNFQGAIFNLTPFVMKVNTSVSKNGGQFQLTLPPLIAENINGTWQVKRKSIQFYQNSDRTSLQGTGYIAEGSLYDVAATSPSDESTPHGEPPDILIRNQFLFHDIISTNDLVFVRFETLKLEGQERITDARQLYVSNNSLPGRVYDMIGLVDLNIQTIQPAAVDVSIQVQGRDLSKLFIEDGAYFFFLEMSQGMIGGPGSATNGISQRLAADNALQYLSLYFNNTIDNVFKFVINQLSNIKICPDELFTPYGNRRNYKYTQQSDKEKFNTLDDQTAACKSAAIAAIKNVRNIASVSLAAPAKEDTAANSVFDEMKRFLRAVRTQKVRRAVGSLTDGWQPFKYTNVRDVTEDIEQDVFPDYFEDNLFNLRETRVVNESKPIVQNVDKILDIEDSKTNFQNQFDKVIMPGIWQIIKLVIDKAVLGRRIIDSSLSSANGPLLNFFKKVCQEPFVEFYMDTYGDQYYLTIRKPPTDQSSILTELQANVQTESQTIQSDFNGENVSTISPAVISIEPEDVLFEELVFADADVASWYHIVPQANFTGSQDAFSLSYLPAVFFPEYADIWGSRPLQLTHNYLPMMPKDPNVSGLDYAQKQAVEDMKYLIESNAYLPFTRRGTIKINGDRRIKYGNLIRYKATGEIFRVVGVRQDWSQTDNSIDRTTSIDVERGMVEQLIYGVTFQNEQTGEVKVVSYFDIIDTNPVFQYNDVTTYKTEQRQVGTQQTNFAKPDIPVGSPFQLASTSSTLPTTVQQTGNLNLQELDLFSDEVKGRFTQFINGSNQLGYWVNITSGVRSHTEQLALYNANHNNARPYHSKHETRLAMDVNLINMKTGVTIKKADSIKTWLDTGVVTLAQTLGMSWGGNSWANYYDPVHFELNGTGGFTPVGEIVPVYETVTTAVKGKALDVAKIFSNFKVDKDVFNFFLTRQQLQKQYLVSDGQKKGSLSDVVVTPQ